MGLQILQYEFLGPVPLAEWGPPMGELLYLVLSKRRDRFNMLYADDCEHTDDRAFFVQHPRFKCWVEKAGSDTALHLAVLPMAGSGTQRRQAVLHRIVSSYRPPCNPPPDLSKAPSYNVRRARDATTGDPNVKSGNKDGDAGPAEGRSDGVGSNDDDDDGGSGGDKGGDANGSNGSRDDAGYGNGGDGGDSGGNVTDSDDRTAASATSSRPPEDDDAVACPCCGSGMAREREIGKISVLYRCGGCGMSDTRLR